ncbi:hypothetical protein [Parasulfitobacter algicola]|uniref:DUF4168 domain-containing protein n=1 Tax=Parasulfitobacter algicola TaxID=2614809 RepID=A0ABX2IT16_9RHOB|nr:hypothetical protein [Sulfitobacter algicola]NSX53947.1 hypothetical protein [Sulfitobacter algicola]
MYVKVSLAALALAAAPAFANDQLAGSVGVDAGSFTTSQLAQLKSALEGDDQNIASFIKAGGSEVISTQSGISAGHAQLAQSLGLDANEYSVSELARIKSIRDSDEG